MKMFFFDQLLFRRLSIGYYSCFCLFCYVLSLWRFGQIGIWEALKELQGNSSASSRTVTAIWWTSELMDLNVPRYWRRGATTIYSSKEGQRYGWHNVIPYRIWTVLPSALDGTSWWIKVQTSSCNQLEILSIIKQAYSMTSLFCNLKAVYTFNVFI